MSNKHYELLDAEEVINFLDEKVINNLGSTRQTQEALKSIEKSLPFPANELYKTGSTCRALQFKTGRWKKGTLKLHLSLFFCPDEVDNPQDTQIQDSSEFPLDDLRRSLDAPQD